MLLLSLFKNKTESMTTQAQSGQVTRRKVTQVVNARWSGCRACILGWSSLSVSM